MAWAAYNHNFGEQANFNLAVARYEWNFHIRLTMVEWWAAFRVFTAPSLDTPDLRADMALLRTMPGTPDFWWIGRYGLRVDY